jgi:ribosomal protein S21
LKVQVKNNVDRALRKLKRGVSDKLQEYRERQFYEKPSDARRKARKAAIKRWNKKQNDLSKT